MQVGRTPAVQGMEGRCFAAGPHRSRLCLYLGDTGEKQPLWVFGTLLLSRGMLLLLPY